MRTGSLAVVLGFSIITLPMIGSAQSNLPPRTFPQFVGTWVLDEAASTGKLQMAPPVARTFSIATTPETVTVTKVLSLPPERPEREGKRRATDHPAPEVYRFDGAETVIPDQWNPLRELRYSFRLVADALALTIKDGDAYGRGNFSVVTDAYAANGDVLTVHRQISTVLSTGQIATMSSPAANFPQTYIYRRAAN